MKQTIGQIESSSKSSWVSTESNNHKENHVYILMIVIFQVLLLHMGSVEETNSLSLPLSQERLGERFQKGTLRELLPYEATSRKEGALRTGLNEYLMLIKALREASLEFHNGNLEKFDSLVGENACQIRAIFIAGLASKKRSVFSNFEEKIATITKEIDSLMDAKKMNALMSSGISLSGLMEAHRLDIEMNFEEMFLFQSFLLTIAKTVSEEPSLCRKEFSDSNKLKMFGDVSSSFAKNLVNNTRKLLSINSVQHVRNLASAKKDPVLNKMVSDDFTLLHNNLLCMPMFWSCKAIFECMHQEKIPLAIHVQFLNRNNEEYQIIDEEILFFESISKREGGWDFVAMQSSIDKEIPICTVKGVVCLDSSEVSEKDSWREKFLSFPLMHVILSGAADHRQYPDPDMNQRVESLGDQEYEFFRAMAKEHGFSLENPTNFFINHVYATKAESLLLKNKSCGIA